MRSDLARDPQENPWDAIYLREGRVFADPFPGFDSLVAEFRSYNCEKLLDLGCGNGRHLVHLARLGFQVWGLDSAWYGLRSAREWCRQEGLAVDLVQADMRRSFPFQDLYFDGVLATQVIHHAMFRTILATAAELDRVLKSGGVLFVTVPTRKNLADDYVQVEPGTYVPTTGTEKGLPHHFFSLSGLRDLFSGYHVLDLSTRGSVVNAILAIKP